VAWNVRQANSRVVPHPPMPVTAAQTRGLDPQNNTMLGRFGIGNALDLQRSCPLSIDSGSHRQSSPYCNRLVRAQCV
jgi:hypothetical protein